MLEVFDTNAVGIIRVTEAALPLLREVGEPRRRQRLQRARLVLGQPRALAAGLAFRPIVYGASKAAVSMLTVQYARAVPG